MLNFISYWYHRLFNRLCFSFFFVYPISQAEDAMLHEQNEENLRRVHELEEHRLQQQHQERNLQTASEVEVAQTLLRFAEPSHDHS